MGFQMFRPQRCSLPPKAMLRLTLEIDQHDVGVDEYSLFALRCHSRCLDLSTKPVIVIGALAPPHPSVVPHSVGERAVFRELPVREREVEFRRTGSPGHDGDRIADSLFLRLVKSLKRVLDHTRVGKSGRAVLRVVHAINAQFGSSRGMARAIRTKWDRS
jgi:hypothetical protein